MGIVRKTRSVALILNEFGKETKAVAAIELIKRLSTRINKTTIYRVLDKLEDDGVVHSFLGKDGIKWYAKCNNGCTKSKHLDVHPHFECVNCGKVDCLTVEVKIPKIPNRDVITSQVLLQGTCELCV